VNYERIYAEFVNDRRRREAVLSGYSERHHIVPRCMGGDDEPGNLIRLTPEDHIVAHLLLARIYGGRLWYALTVMMRPAKRLGIVLRGKRARRVAALARRKQAELQLGVLRPDVSAKLSGRAKSEEHKNNLSKARFGSRDSAETRLKKKRAMNDASVKERIFTAERARKISVALTGRERSAEHSAAIARAAKGRYTGKANPRFDRTIRLFVHDDGSIEHLTKFEMAQKYGLNRTCLNYVISRQRAKTGGWSFAGVVKSET